MRYGGHEAARYDHERRRRARMALQDDAKRCRDAGWSIDEWEQRALSDEAVRAVYDDERQHAIEVEAMWRLTWGRR